MPAVIQLKSKSVSTNWNRILELAQKLSYNYDAIGNITTSTPAGVYVYGSSTYANPHAATAVSSTIYSYDNNGNLTSDSTWTHTWDYRNRLTQSTKTGATSTYAYDHTVSRVKLVTASTTNIIPSQYYSTENGTAVKYISANGQLIATIRGTGASSSLYAMHSDHLGNVEKTTNTEGAIVEISDYFPYGSLRQNTTYGGFNDRKGFIGKDTDTDTGLSQLEARYYKSDVGRFMSQDPVFWEVGMTQDGKAVLENPQLQDSYGYANNNPITYSDPEGRVAPLLVLGYKVSMFWYNASNLISDVFDRNIKNAHPDVFSQEQRDAANFRVRYDLAMTGLGAAGKLLGLPKAGNALDVLGVAGDLTDAWRESQAVDEERMSVKKKSGQDDIWSQLQTLQGGSGSGGTYVPPPYVSPANQTNYQANFNFSQNQQSGGGSDSIFRIQLLQQLVSLYTQLAALQNSISPEE